MCAAAHCIVCGATSAKYKCPTCRSPYCSVSCCRTHKETPCSKPDTTAPSTASPRKDQPVTASEPRPKRPFEEEDAEDEDGARLRRKHLISIATSDEIRSALGDERVVNTVIRIDAAIKAEQALDAACEDPDFREFTEKVLNILAAEDETD